MLIRSDICCEEEAGSHINVMTWHSRRDNNKLQRKSRLTIQSLTLIPWNKVYHGFWRLILLTGTVSSCVQALPVKLLAVAAFTGLANLPSGAFRVHVKKFSPGWILAVHATIPFIAVIRKAVVMPKWAIAFTVGSAVLGQLMGARLERQRMLDYQLLVEERKNGSKNSSSGGGTAPAHAADGIMGWPRAVGLQCREQAFALGIGCSPIVA